MKLVIFDIDGTLVDSQHLICGAMHQAYDRHGLPKPARQRVLALVGLSLPDTFTRLANGAAHPIETLVEAYRDAFQTLRARPNSMEPLYPGALQEGVRIELHGLSSMRRERLTSIAAVAPQMWRPSQSI